MKKNLSKSKLIAFRQCPKRLWLEVHRKELRADSAATQTAFQVGHTVGELARRLYDPEGRGHLISIDQEGFRGALARTKDLLKQDRPIFEAGFSAGGVLAFADILLKRKPGGKGPWHVVEVKSSGDVHPYQRDDLAVQAFAMREAGLTVGDLSIAHVDGTWTYPGNEDYDGLLKEVDLTEEAKQRGSEVKAWVRDARKVVEAPDEPEVRMGSQCSKPFACGFADYCSGQAPKTQFPVAWLPRVQSKALKAHLADPSVIDLRQVPDELLNERQLRVKAQTLQDAVFFDVRAASAELLKRPMPALFLDFETVMFTVPIWAGTRPFQQIPFQFSAHVLHKNGRLSHEEFIDLTGKDPSRPFAEALLRACGEQGTVYVYNASFEEKRIEELAQRFRDLARPLKALLERLVDLRPIAESNYYHPAQKGSWSIKAVAPTIAPDLDYANLDGIAHGGAAAAAYGEAIDPGTSAGHRQEIEAQLRRYCARDTEALVRFWQMIR